MNKILIFDDRYQIRNYLQDELKLENFECELVKDIYGADEHMEKEMDNISSIILDIMMPSLGLNDEERTLSKAGTLTGWVWLWYHQNQNKQKPHPLADKKIIIYSAFLNDFNLYIESNQPSDDEKRFADKVFKISKETTEDKVIEEMAAIIRD